MDKEAGDLVTGGKTVGGTMSLDQAIDAAVKSHQRAFPYAGCSSQCMWAQLEGYYQQMCCNSRLKAVDMHGNQHKTPSLPSTCY